MAAHSDPLPPAAEPYATEIREIEAELDALWPDYQRIPFNKPTMDGGAVLLPGYKLRGRPFTVGGRPAEPYRLPHVMRLKWLLKRHELLMQGLDYGIHIAAGQGRQDGACFAHPLGPDHHPAPPAKVGPPAFPLALQGAPVAAEPRVTPMDLALATGRSLETVQAALRTLPPGADPQAHVENYRPWRPA